MLAAYCRPLPPFAALVLSRRHRMHAHPEPPLVLVLELDLPVDDGEQRVVGRAADVRPGMELRAALPDDDRARGDELPGEAFHAEVLGPGVAAVAGGTDTLLVCHASVTQSLSLTSAIFTSVNGCRCPAWRRYPLRRANRRSEERRVGKECPSLCRSR